MSVDQKGKVFLVGAGPGDPGLITIKGKQCIEKADVLIYDRLASPRLLSFARPGAEMIYVGKLPNRHTLQQDEINRLLVEKALAGKTVTRLKGGDPFVFGRGGEEAEALALRAIPFEVVPGITAAVSVPAYAGIPVTHRGFTSSFTVVTGHEDPAKDQSGIDWPKLAGTAGTLVFLMGVANLPQITGQLIKHGRSPQTPVAVVRWGTRPEQETLTGTLEDIVEKVARAGFTSPAVTVVGEVVGLRQRLSWYEKLPLFGRRVVVTRSRRQAGVLSRMIEELGGEAWEFPVIAIQPPEDWSRLDTALDNISGYHWLVFTSVNGVEYFFTRLRERKGDIRRLAGCRLAAIGPQTRAALEAMALQVDFCPEEYRAEAVLAGLKGVVEPGDKVLMPRADIARDLLPQGLRALGAVVDDVPAYRTCRGAGDADAVREMLQAGKISAVTFASSSTVKNFVELIGAEREELQQLLSKTVVASIGPITSGTARDMGLRVDVEASSYTIPNLVQALIEYLQQQRTEAGEGGQV